jgi:hypothetical protein
MHWGTNAYRILVGKTEGKRPLRRSGSRRITLNWILKRVWTGFNWPWLLSSCGYWNSITARKFLDQLIDIQNLKSTVLRGYICGGLICCRETEK